MDLDRRRFFNGAAAFAFRSTTANGRYCLSADGEGGRNCMAAFRGSLAIARYRERLQSHPAKDEPLFDGWSLFLEPQRAPFLFVYSKRTLASIRALDVIPGDETWVDQK